MNNIDKNKLIEFVQEEWNGCPMCGSKELLIHPKRTQFYGLVAVDHVNKDEVTPKDEMLILIPIICNNCAAVKFIIELEFQRLLKDKEMDDEDAV